VKKTIVLCAMLLGIATAQFPSLGGAAAAMPFNGKVFTSDPSGLLKGAPYLEIVSYYGYIKPGTAPDAVVNGKKTYYLYVWIPLAANEMGLRMLSPAQGKPAKADFVSSTWKEGEADKANCFDTWIQLERSTIVTAADITKDKVASATWFNFGNNDDSSELPANCKGQKYNSVLRYTSQLSDPLKMLVIGLYRVGFTTYKVGEVQGTFLAQAAFSIKIPGVVVGTDLEVIQKQALADLEKAKKGAKDAKDKADKKK